MQAPLPHRKKEGFDGQKAIVLPKKVIEFCKQAELINNLYITDIGFYPKAKFHYRRRPSGVPQHILIYCTDGEGWLEISPSDNKQNGSPSTHIDRNRKTQHIRVERGQYIIIPSSLHHVYGSAEHKPWTIHWLHFKGTQADAYGNLLSQKNTSFSNSVTFSEERIALFDRMYSTLETGYSADNLTFVNLCLSYFLSSLIYPDIFLLPQRKEQKDIIDLSIAFMRENLHRPLSVNELAAHIYISASYFSRLFKEKTGYPPLEYFNHIKIQKACQYLQFTDIHVKEVAWKLGFNDQFYFSRLFNNIMGIPPVEYRSGKKYKSKP